ncbi:MAG: hypothetical protein MJ094_05055 [Saccharofermentans sp.]|nr:hypothetical protein [Saccharofermentans sp.]
MKFLKNLFKFILGVIVILVVLILCRPLIDRYLNSIGIETGTSNFIPMPVTETFYSNSGELMYSVSIPATYNNLIPQSELNKILESSNGLVQINQNSDGSISCIMTPEVRSEVLYNASEACDNNVLTGLVTGNIVSINHNENYSVFYVVAQDNASEAELLSLSGKLFAIGEVYGALEGNQDDSCRIEVYSASTNQLVNTFNSNNIAGDVTGDAIEYLGDTISDGFDGLASLFSSN